MCEKTITDQRENHSKGLEGTIYSDQTGMGIVLIYTSQSGKPHNS